MLSRVSVPLFFKALGVCPITKSECSPIAGGFSSIYGKRFLRGFVLRKGFLQTKKEMANENFGSIAGESSPQNKRAQSESGSPAAVLAHASCQQRDVCDT